MPGPEQLPRLLQPDLPVLRVRGKILSEATEYVPAFLVRQDTLLASSVEVTECSPVIPTDELIRIRDEATRRCDTLAGVVNGIGSGLESQGVVDAYRYFWAWIEGRNWCIYSKDQPIFDQIQAQAQRSNSLLAEAGNRFLSNFRQRWFPMREVFQELRNAADSATIDIRPTLDAYKKFWSRNFHFSLHRSLNTELDSLLNEYSSLTDASETEFNRGNAKVQANFDAHFEVLRKLHTALSKARQRWENEDGRSGYNDFQASYAEAVRAFEKWSQFVVLKTPQNDAKFSESRQWASDIRSWWSSFPNLTAFSASAGMQRGGGIPDYKFFCTAGMAQFLRQMGEAYQEISQDGSGYEFRNLFVTNLSYEHGGRFPPHSEHRDGRDADIWGRWIDKTKPDYRADKAVAIIGAALRLGAQRVIYSDQAVVDQVNDIASQNGWPGRAANLSAHEDHIHVDVA